MPVICLMPLAAWFCLCASSTSAAPRDPKIAAAVRQAAKYIAANAKDVEPAEEGLAAYALLKAELKLTDPAVQVLLKKVLAKIRGGRYRPLFHHTYEAGVDLMALEAADPKRYRREIQVIVQYIASMHQSGGQWDYPEGQSGGDTSISQYGVLGLWAAARAGVAVPPQLWDKAAGWHVRTQMNDGGFAYQPAGSSEPSTRTMSVAGTSSLLVCRRFLYPNRTTTIVSPKKKTQDKRFDVLTKIDLAAADKDLAEKPKGPNRGGIKPKTSLVAINKSINGGNRWLTTKYTAAPKEYPYYYLYGLERATALADWDKLGRNDWFADGSAYILSHQDSDGKISGGGCGDIPSAAFAILFLTRATSKILGKKPKPKTPIDGGLLAGGRGLPDDLKKTQLTDGKVKERKITGPIDKLLAELQSPQDGDFISAQEAIVEKVQLGNREDLIGQKYRLMKLAKHPHAEVRRTVIWALGRTDDLSVAPVLLKAIDDVEVDVMVEARNALCFLSRKPRGFGMKNTPLGESTVDATDTEKKEIVAKWRAQAKRNWQGWYFAVRPYAERDDLTQPSSRKRKRARSSRR
jgi:hypothetical protein